MDELLAGLRAAAEPTRLRLLALCANHELTVTELTGILGQSQPRVSRHLKVLCDGGLLERYPEGASVFYRLRRAADQLPQNLVALIPADDALRQRDGVRLAEIQTRRAERASSYFESNAHHWDAIRGLHVPETEVEQRLVEIIGRAGLAANMDKGRPRDMLDIGTGTGRMLDLLSPHIASGIGVDSSREMLSVARVNLDRAQCHHCAVRQADMYALPFGEARFDLVLFHQVLHFAERPADALVEAARVLKPGGQLVVVDFMRHDLEYLREQHAHRRLGFSEADVIELGLKAGIDFGAPVLLPSDQLTVAIWSGSALAAGSHQQEDKPAAAAA